MENKVLVVNCKYWCFLCQKECQALLNSNTQDVECNICKNTFIEVIEENEEDPRDFIPNKNISISNINNNTLFNNTNNFTINRTVSHRVNNIITTTTTSETILNNGNTNSTTIHVRTDYQTNLNENNNSNSSNTQQSPNIFSNFVTNILSDFQIISPNFFNSETFNQGIQIGNNIFNAIQSIETNDFENILNTLFLNDATKIGTPPTAEKIIKKLPRIRIAEDNLYLYKELECIICRDVPSIDDILIELPCLHKNHEDCILLWLKKHSNCPVCRFELETDDINYENRKKNRK